MILDVWTIQKMAAAQRNDLMEIIEERYGLKATLTESSFCALCTPYSRPQRYLRERFKNWR